MSLAQRRILVGVSGGIAAYKSCELVRRLRDLDAEVRVVMTESATHFVSPTTFQALSGQSVRVSLWDAQAEAAMGHIELARWAERILIAPASADLLARLAHGMADDLLTTLCLASAAPLYLAPAMNQQMWAHPAVQANIDTLRQRGAYLLGPAIGDQACGDVGSGRMLEPHELRDALLVNPYDIDQTAEAIRAALEMEPDDKELRMRRMRKVIKEHNIYRWAGNLITELCEVRLDAPQDTQEKSRANVLVA